MSEARERARAFREEIVRDATHFDRGSDVLSAMTPAELVQAIPILGTLGEPHGKLLAQTAAATLSWRLNEALIEHLDNLDASNERLTKVGWLLALVGILVAVVDVLVELKFFG